MVFSSLFAKFVTILKFYFWISRTKGEIGLFFKPFKASNAFKSRSINAILIEVLQHICEKSIHKSVDLFCMDSATQWAIKIRASLGVPENSAFMDVEKILKIVHVKNKFWKNSEESDFKNYVF